MSERDEAGDRELAGLPTLFGAVLYKRALLLLRYPVNTLAQIVSVYLFFVVLFFGGKAAVENVGGGAGALGGTFDGLVVGWFLWTMSLAATSASARTSPANLSGGRWSNCTCLRTDSAP